MFEEKKTKIRAYLYRYNVRKRVMVSKHIYKDCRLSLFYKRV